MVLNFSGSLNSYATPAKRWSCAFVPTDGRLTFVSIPSALRFLGSPIPESSRTCGDLIALPNERENHDLWETFSLKEAERDLPGRKNDLAVRGDQNSVLLSVKQEFDAVGSEAFTRRTQNPRDGRVHKHPQVRTRASLFQIGLHDMGGSN